MPTLVATASRLKVMLVLPRSALTRSVEALIEQVRVAGIPAVAQLRDSTVIAPAIAVAVVQGAAPHGAAVRQATKPLSHLASATLHGSWEGWPWLFVLQRHGVVSGGSHEQLPANA